MNNTWQVAVIVAPNCEPPTVSADSSYMPLWIVDTPDNAQMIKTMWSEKRDFTSFKVVDGERRTENLLRVFDTLELHHPFMTCVHVFGLDSLEPVQSQMSSFGFIPAKQSWPDSVALRRGQIDWTDAPALILDATNWHTSDDVYDDLFRTLRSPSWHGRNLNALHDSIVTGQINGIEVPYRLEVVNINDAAPAAKRLTEDLLDLICEFEEKGCPVSMSISFSRSASAAASI